MVACAVFAAGTVGAEDFVSEFGPGPVSWAVEGTAGNGAVRSQARRSADGARTVEVIRFAEASRTGGTIVHPLPRSSVFSETSAAVTIRSPGRRVRVALRIECPDVLDPVTGRPVLFDLGGEAAGPSGEWQTLACRCEPEVMEKRLTLLRSALRRDGAADAITFKRLVSRAVVLKIEAADGGGELLVDRLRFGPLATGGASRPAAAPAAPDTPRGPGPMDLVGQQLRVEGRAFVPRVVSYRGEATDTLAAVGMNVASVGGGVDPDVRAALRAAGLWLTTRPPGAGSGDRVRPASASTPAALGPETRDVLFWSLPASESVASLDAVVASLRQADRLHDRPRPLVAAAPAGGRTAVSRRVDLLETRLPMTHGSRTPRQSYRELDRLRRQAAFGKRSLAAVAVEGPPAAGVGAAVMEPEQIWMQAELAVAAGHRGVRYQTRTPLDSADAAERRAALAILNRRLDLASAWVAAGRFEGVYPVRVLSAGGLRYHPSVLAAVLSSDRGHLVWLVTADESGHLVPAPMAASDLLVTVRGGSELSSAYEVSEVGLRALDARRVSGGTEIRLPRFDQSAILLLTPFESVVDDLRRRTREGRGPVLTAWTDLAAAKLERVTNSHAAIEAAAPSPMRGGDAQLAEARLQLEQARDAAAAGDHHECRRHARLSLQMLRILQDAHARNALNRLSGPGATTASLAFSSLPAHWQQLATLGRSEDRGVVLDAGFDSLDAMLADGWRSRSGGGETAVELTAAEGADGLALRLVAGEPPTPGDALTPRLAVESPPLRGEAGELLLIKARVRGLPARKPGLLRISDSFEGTDRGLVVTVSPERWEEVELVRPAAADSPLSLTLELLGSGAVCVDRILVRAYREPAAVEPDPTPEEPRKSPLPRFPRLPRRWWGGGVEEPPAVEITPDSPPADPPAGS